MRKISGFWLCGWLLLGMFFGSQLVLYASAADNSWRIRINIPEYRLELFNGIEHFKSYPVAIGRSETPSPMGNFFITVKVVNPTWYPPDHRPPVPPGPKNPLGKYWLGLSQKGYGIHGNSEPSSIGSSVSLGCFRMRNQDIAEVFGLVSVGTPVDIVYETVRPSIDQQNQAWLELFPDIYHWGDQDAKVLNAIDNLAWNCQVHLRALAELIKDPKRPLKFPLPRVIRIIETEPGPAETIEPGNGSNPDGFYWNGSIYLAKSVFTTWRVETANGVDPTFHDYFNLQFYEGNNSGFYWKWDEANNTLRVGGTQEAAGRNLGALPGGRVSRG